ncbi:hypothetical protein C8F04DRAFT_1236250 [Mycena alexandri]|uniref:F-box domain-containing protein n=1 Tax=Mycena alexandri TaxID=1745969 RepID=A0AAD6WXG6_9AGAR|nr:hypothetical protein C8F04DRAFT_1236250 [Mycena alexandri]
MNFNSDVIYQSHGYQNELLPKMLWNAGRELSRLCWNPFIRRKDSGPITDLPFDILGEIFQWCIYDDYGFGPLDARGVLLLEPLVLSHVSRQWREVALSVPLLWSTIWVDRPRAVHVPMIELWLQNSRQCPLVLHLRQTVPPSAGQQPLPFTHPREYELTDTVLFLLGNHLHRWKRITFLFHHTAQRSLLSLSESPTAAPLLEHIQLLNSSWDDHSRAAMGRILYSYASVKSIVMQRKMVQEFIRWDRLTVLDVADMSAPICNYLSVLERCRSLRRADLRITTNPGENPAIPTTRPLHLDHLYSLTIKAELLDLAPFFGCLVLPKLEDLSLNYVTALRRASDPASLQRLITRSGCVLKRFSLREDAPVKKNDDHHLSFLRGAGMLSLLELCLKIDLTDNIIEFLTLGNADDDKDPRPRWLPNLHTIALKDLRGDHVEDIKLYRMVVSRLPPPTPDRNGRYSAALRRAYFNLRVKDHSSSAVLPVLLERCRERIDLSVYLSRCPHQGTIFGRYTAPPLAGGFLP